jgi:hypothetical protein
MHRFDAFLFESKELAFVSASTGTASAGMGDWE